ncbi:hypothetical protein H4219_004676, partial [Mycoemilia scoparia]
MAGDNKTKGVPKKKVVKVTASKPPEPKKDAEFYEKSVKDIKSVDVLDDKIKNAKTLEEKAGYEKALKELKDKQAAE